MQRTVRTLKECAVRCLHEPRREETEKLLTKGNFARMPNSESRWQDRRVLREQIVIDRVIIELLDVGF